jgi:hypothetical protein
MKTFKQYAMTLVLGSLVASAGAADFDGSKPLICSAIEANDCASGAACAKGLAADINVPQFIRLNVPEKTVSARGRTSAIQNLSRGPGVIVVQGFENQRAWSITVWESGKLVAAVAGEEEGFVIFGACTAL